MLRTCSRKKIIPLETNNGDCYEFVIYDAGNNGTEYYAVIYGNNDIAFEGGSFGSHERNEFSYYFVGVNEIAAFTDVNVYPNPATDFLNVSFELRENTGVTVELFDISGKKVFVENAGKSSAGTKHFTLNTANLRAGLYILNVRAGGYSFAKKVSVR